MSGLLHITTKRRTSREVRFVPTCDIANASRVNKKPPEGGPSCQMFSGLMRVPS